LDRSCRIGWTRTICPPQEICTEAATIATCTLRPRQARPPPVVGAGEGDVARPVRHPGHHRPAGGRPGTPTALPQLLRLFGVGSTSLDVFGDQHLTVEDPDQMLGGDRLHRFPSQLLHRRQRPDDEGNQEPDAAGPRPLRLLHPRVGRGRSGRRRGSPPEVSRPDAHPAVRATRHVRHVHPGRARTRRWWEVGIRPPRPALGHGRLRPRRRRGLHH
jgi:hypothetical protein